MNRFVKLVALLSVSTPLAQMPAFAEPAGEGPRVTQPYVTPYVTPPYDPQPSPGFAGYWKAQDLLYGRFNLKVRLDESGRGEYFAGIGEGERCEGNLSWKPLPFNFVQVNLSSSWCNGPSGKWSADKMTCAPEKGYGIAVPGSGYGPKLTCWYFPGRSSYWPTKVSFRRS